MVVQPVDLIKYIKFFAFGRVIPILRVFKKHYNVVDSPSCQYHSFDEAPQSIDHLSTLNVMQSNPKLASMVGTLTHACLTCQTDISVLIVDYMSWIPKWYMST